MGEIVATDNGDIDGNVKAETGETGGKRADSESTCATDTAGERTGARLGGRTGSADTGNAESVISGKANELSILTDDERKRYDTANEAEKKKILKNARRRQQYAEKKRAGGQTVKPRKVNGRKAQAQTIEPTSINMMIMSLSAIVASRPNCEHWLLTEAEVNSISEPLCKMLADSSALETIGQYSNQIALVMACITVFVPRLMVTVQKQKEVKKIERTGQHTDTTVRSINGGKATTTKTGDTKSNRGNDGQSPANGANVDKGQPWYGMPISG